MKFSTALFAEPLDAVPEARFGGTDGSIPLIAFAGTDRPSLHLTDLGDDLPAWLRAFAANLTAFADEVEARS